MLVLLYKWYTILLTINIYDSQQGKMIKPNFNSVDLGEVELPITGENVEDVYETELPVRLLIIHQKHDLFW